MKKILKLIIGIAVGFICLGVLIGFLGDKTASTTPTTKNDAKFIVKITGTEGAEFTGNYMLITWDGNSVSKSLEGKIPAEYPLDGSIISTVFQKKTEKGDLNVQIFKGDKIVAESNTSVAYGTVSAATK